jgi:hypothetical protein
LVLVALVGLVEVIVMLYRIMDMVATMATQLSLEFQPELYLLLLREVLVEKVELLVYH